MHLPRLARLAAASVSLLFFAGPVAAAAAPTPAPTPAGHSAAGADAPTSPPVAAPSSTPRNAVQARRVKRQARQAIEGLRTRIDAERQEVARLTASASATEQQYNAQLVRQKQAQRAAAEATVAVQRAAAAYQQAHVAFIDVLVTNYEEAGPGGLGDSPITILLTASNPGAALDTASMQQEIAAQQSDLAYAAHRLLTARENAERRRNAALAHVQRATRRLAALRAASVKALAKANATVARLQTEMTEAHYSQRQAVRLLSTFLGGWQTADQATATQLNQHYDHIAESVKGTPLPASTGAWTPAIGEAVADRAIQWIGTPYAWAGGTAQGPSQGICAGGLARQDCHVVGFDCSGLALYAWAPYLAMDHLAATQYGYGSMHPDITRLRPGDLTFWSTNGTAAGIHHVAIYVGNGLVIQAPNSGDIVRITPLADVASGYFGATRPLT